MKSYNLCSKQGLATVLIFAISAMLFSSCEKVIDLDLKSSGSRIVIEGNMTDSLGRAIIEISRSVDYNSDNNFPEVTNALVCITDENGNVDTLTEESPGKYFSQIKLYPSEHTYTLDVTADGKSYTAKSYMPRSVEIDSLGIEILNGFGLTNRKLVNVYYHDSLNVDNYYRIIEYINGERTGDVFYDNDEFRDGKKISYTTFNRDDDDELHPGDTVRIYLLSVDKAAFDYIRTFDLINGDNSGQQASPANPISNISNDALGVFSAYSITTKEIIIP